MRLADDPPHPVLAKPENEGKPSLHDRIVETLRRSPDPITRTELRRLLVVQNTRLGSALNTLASLAELDPRVDTDERRALIIRPLVRLAERTRYIVAVRRLVNEAETPLRQQIQ